MEAKTKQRIPLRFILLFVAMLAVYVAILWISYQNMSKSLYRERVANTNLLMDKIIQNTETGVDTAWNNLYHFKNIFTDGMYFSLDEAQGKLKTMRDNCPADVHRIFIVDENGECRVSSGRTFSWNKPELLNSGRDECYIYQSEYEKDTKYMSFITPFSEPVEIDGIKITHIGINISMAFMDSFFSTHEYGDESIAFIIRKDGEQIYRKNVHSHELENVNIIKAFEEAEFNYGLTYEEFVSDINRSVASCISMEYNGVPYYVTYQGLNTNDWTALIMIPEENVGSATVDFMWSVVTSIVTICIGAIVLLVAVIWYGTYRVAKQREEVTEQLIKAAEAERSANNAKTKFLSSMSHDIRTPMNAIIGMTALAAKHIDDTEYAKNCLSKATLASNHLLTLINDVLDISKVESGKMGLNPTVFSLVEATSNLVNIIRPQIDAKNHQLEVRVHNISYEYLFADELRINQIFINILSNAVKYTPENGKISIDIKEIVSEGKDTVKLVYEVKDNGVGMTKEFQEQMYTSFARANDEHTGAIQGTGLGLAICKQMVDLMEGMIECESAPGEGTTFTVTLELPIADKITDELVLPPMELLLVDDDEIFLETASDTLSDMGLTVDCVASGEEAVSVVENRHISGKDYPVIVIDWKMPGMDGIEATRRIRKEVGDEVSIIVISAYAPEEIEEQAKEAGADGFIPKPFFRSTIYRSMSNILGLSYENESSNDSSHVNIEGMRLLVAEDNDLNWEIAKEILGMYGVKTFRANNGRECVDIISEAKDSEYDLILMDIQMPVMNGYEATQAIRASERAYLKNIPIIAMTADAFAEDIQHCKDVGMNAHIAKPIDVDNLLEVIGDRGK